MSLLLDVFFFGDLVFSISEFADYNVIIKASLLIISFIFVLVFINRDKNYILCTPVMMLPVLFYNRELVEVKTHNFTLGLFDIVLLFVVLIFTRKKFILNKKYDYIFITLTFIGLIPILSNGMFVNINAFMLSYLLPMLYLSSLIKSQIRLLNIQLSILFFIILSVLIFIFQNIYIGPIVVYQSTVAQSWLNQGISMANGGFLEIGSMQIFLITFSSYLFYYKYVIKFENKITCKLISFLFIFSIILPFIYQNRANCLLSITFIIFISYCKLSRIKFLLSIIVITPLFVLLFYVVLSRTFINENILNHIFSIGELFKNVDYTTLNHLKSTLSCFEIVFKYPLTGYGLLRDPNSAYENVFRISNLRNYILPSLEICASLGIIFFSFYVYFIFKIYSITTSFFLKFLLLLQFIPIVGSSKFFGLYATGTIEYRTGFTSLSDKVPVSIFSFFFILIVALSVFHKTYFKKI